MRAWFAGAPRECAHGVRSSLAPHRASDALQPGCVVSCRKLISQSGNRCSKMQPASVFEGGRVNVQVSDCKRCRQSTQGMGGYTYSAFSTGARVVLDSPSHARNLKCEYTEQSIQVLFGVYCGGFPLKKSFCVPLLYKSLQGFGVHWCRQIERF